MCIRDRSILLEEEIDENFEPTPEEINEYAKMLGMSLPFDNDLLWIVREGLKAPLPPDWKICQSRTGDVYYINLSTSEKTYEHPCDEHYRTIYLREKAKKQSGKGIGESQVTMKDSRLVEKPQLNSLKLKTLQPLPSLQSNLAPAAPIHSISQQTSLVAPVKMKPKVDDPLLKLEKEKKLGKYREEKEAEFSKKKEEIERYAEERQRLARNHLEEQVEATTKNRKSEFEKILSSLKDKIFQARSELENERGEDIRDFTKDYERKENERKEEALEKYKQEWREKILRGKKELQAEKRSLLIDEKDKLGRTIEAEIESLEEEVARLRIKSTSVTENEVEERLKELVIQQRQEIDDLRAKYKREVEALSNRIRAGTTKAREADESIFQAQLATLDELYSSAIRDKETKIDGALEEELNREYERSLEDLERHITKRKDIEMVRIRDTIDERISVEETRAKGELARERDEAESIWRKTKEEILAEYRKELRDYENRFADAIELEAQKAKEEVEECQRSVAQENEMIYEKIRNLIRSAPDQQDLVFSNLRSNYEKLYGEKVRAEQKLRSVNGECQMALIEFAQMETEVDSLVRELDDITMELHKT
eukprot:TRINITY_DN7467_c0_g1_i3.p1 TRINITY_DN7467_c0_g1~~TRINITY_DN7467_c0_g1_i3.p1  ORF type:complete len:599 (+),score=172.45 TRINITY_DN7467_c0_g1_i3:64-1860(+)